MTRIIELPRKTARRGLWWVKAKVQGHGTVQHAVRAQDAISAWERFRERVYPRRHCELDGVRRAE